MALTISTQVNPIATKLIVQTSATATPDNNMLGMAGTVYMIEVDNTANAASSYLKFYDNGAPTVGTTVPDFVVRVKAGQRRPMVIPEGLDFTILSMACVTTGGTAGATSPASPVVVRLACG
ncbi:MAG: hypothetical protein PHR35_14695 [Kiritimatiellae bacterium]|nr:hypothetical protein [Kiritimatiellia bacterium]